MADRSVKVTLRANVTDFNQQIKQASKTLEELAAKGDKTGKVADTSMGRMAQRATLMSSEMTTAGTAIAGFGAGLLAISGAAVKTAADFDAAMSIVQADTHAGASEMNALREAAIQAGADTVFSASEAAEGIDELAKAGVSTADILGGGLSGALDLAAAGGISVGEAAETAATAMTQFKLSGSDVTHVADLLAAGAGKAQGGVHDLAFALKQGGLVASQMGLSIEETVGGLSAFASAGLIGSDAGTSFKTMLQRLANPADKAATLMDELGLHAYDAQGNFVGLANFAGQLQDKLGSLSAEQRNAAMSTIFGSDAIRAANVLYSQGAAGIQEWIDKVNDQGYAAETAAARMDNLKGDMEQLIGSVETLFIKMGEGGQGPLRTLVQGATDVVNALGEMGPVGQSVLLAVTGLGGAAMVGVGGFMVLVPKIVETKAAMDALGITASNTRSKVGEFFTSTSKLGRLGRMAGMAGLITSIAAVGAASKDAGISVEEATNRLIQMGKGANTAATAFTSFDASKFSAAEISDGLRQIADPSIWEGIKNGTSGFLDNFSAAFGVDTRGELSKMKDDLESYGQALASMDASHAVDAFKQLAEMTDGSDEALTSLIKSMPAFRNSLIQMANEAGMAADDATLLALATGKIDPAATGAGSAASGAAGDIAGMGDDAEDAAKKVTDLVDSLNDFYGTVLNENQANRAFQAAIDDATDALEKNGQTLDINTSKGRDNQAALDDIAASAWDVVDAIKKHAEANGTLGQSQGAMQEALRQGREAVIEAAKAFGMGQEEAEAYADELGMIPDQITTEVEADTEEAETAIDDLFIKANQQTGSVQIGATTYAAESSLGSILATIDASQGTTTINGETVPASEALKQLLGIIDNSDGTVSIDGDQSRGRYKVGDLVVWTDQQTGQIMVGAKDNATGTVNTIIAGLPKSHTIYINAVQTLSVQRASAELNAGVGRLAAGRATGGPIYGPGTGTSDSILARLSNGEHVWTAAEVRAAGGQSRMLELRALAKAGLLAKNVMGFASGGSPSYAGLPPSVHVSNGAPQVSLTVVTENPLTGEEMTQHIETVADGRIVLANRLNR